MQAEKGDDAGRKGVVAKYKGGGNGAWRRWRQDREKVKKGSHGAAVAVHRHKW